MGEIADMMLEGMLCEGCGEYIDDNDGGIPRYCSESCAKGRGAMAYQPSKPNRSRARKAAQNAFEQKLTEYRFSCASAGCRKRFRSSRAAAQHFDAVHSRNGSA